MFRFSDMARQSFGAPLRGWEMEMLQRKAEEQPESRPAVYLIGVSVGQGSQPTGIAVLLKSGGSNGSFHYGCRYLCRRLPPQTEYPALLTHMQVMLGRPELTDAHLVVEAGGSVQATVHYLRKHRLSGNIHAVEVKASGGASFTEGVWRLGKGTLIDTTRQAQQEGRLVFDNQMPAAIRATTPPVATVYHALANYSFAQAPAANDALAAREGEYDDLVWAVALACWFGERCQRRLNLWV